MKAILSLCLCCVFVFYSCKSNSKISTTEVSATLIDNTGLDGCGWMLQLDVADAQGNKNLIPLNIADFKVELQNGKKVSISYTNASVMNTCMAGATVRLQSLH